MERVLHGRNDESGEEGRKHQRLGWNGLIGRMDNKKDTVWMI